MNRSFSHGMLSVDEMNALFDEQLRVQLPGGSFKVIQHSYSGECGCRVYENNLPLSITVRLEREGRKASLNLPRTADLLAEGLN